MNFNRSITSRRRNNYSLANPRFLILLFSLLLTYNSFAQLVGGRGNGQSSPSEVKASSITAGGFSGDVSLFTGTYNSSYILGSVSTPSGLSFTAALSYSSTYSTGENMPHTSGIPYGEGWNIDLPMISVSTEDYNKYTLWETHQMKTNTNFIPNTRVFNEDEDGNASCVDASKEGDLFWFSPTLNIPGVASGRLVFKEMDASGNAIFVLQKFERYIEVIKRLNVWEVILDDGTRYDMNVQVVSHRNSSNQRMQKECISPVSSKNMLLPKSEINTWYCTRIRNVNAIGSIRFIYNAFGSFNYYKEFDTERMRKAIGAYWFANNQAGAAPNLLPVYKDVILKEIRSGSEKLVLDYESISTANGYQMLDINDTENVTRMDSMYSYQLVKKWGGSDGELFNSWYRYKHLKAEEVPNSEYIQLNKLNPYKGVTNSSNGFEVYYRKKIAASDKASFDHSYLESPRMNLLAGETYEIRTRIFSGNISTLGNLGKDCSFDINLATGDVSPGSSNYNIPTGEEFIDAKDYEKSIGQSLFSTFNQGVKWNNYAADSDWMQTSNFFTMTNLPDEYQGFKVQIGPAISDNAFDLDREQFLTDPNSCIQLSNPPVCNTYLNSLWLEGNIPLRGNGFNNRSGGDIANNFGIGIPFYMMNGLYSELISGGTSSFCNSSNYSSLNFWWWTPEIEPNCSSQDTLINKPTRADNSVLEEVALLRYSKNPYMLKRVTKYVLNVGENTSGEETNHWHEISSMGFDYEIVSTPVFAHKVPAGSGPNVYVSEQKGYRNIVLLKKIKQLPKNWDESSTGEGLIDALPTTHLEYDSAYVNGASLLELSLNSSIAILNKVVDPLGKITTIDYYDDGYHDTKFAYRWRPSDVNLNTNEVRRATPSAHQIYMRVKDITVNERAGQSATRSYSYEDRQKLSMLVPMDDHFKYDLQGNHKFGHIKTTVLGPSLNGNRTKTVYYHHTDFLKWGKAYKVESFDAEGNLMSEMNSTYEAVLAFENPMYRVGPEGDFDYYEYRPNVGAPYHNRPSVNSLNPSEQELKNYYTDLTEWMELHNLTSSGMHPDFSVSAGMYDVPRYYGSRYHKEIEAEEPYLLNSFFIKKTRDIQRTFDNGCNTEDRLSIETTTDYEYFDADYQGKSTSSGYAQLLSAGSYFPETGMYFEPSWQLYSKRTSSSQIGGYTLEENFYHYDLINDQDYWTNFGVHSNFFDLWSIWKRKKTRSMVFQTRVTKVADGEDPIVQSTFYNFTRGWEIDQEAAQILYLDTEGVWPCAADDNNGGGGIDNGGDDNDIWNNLPSGCFYELPLIADDPSIEYCEVEYFPQVNMLCPCDMTFNNDPPFTGEGAGFAEDYISSDIVGDDTSEQPPNPLGGKLMLKSVVQQVDGLSSSGTGVLRFKQNVTGFEPIYPSVDTLTTMTILSRGKYGQAVQVKDARNVITKYEYAPYDVIAQPYCLNGRERYNWLFQTNHIGLPSAVIVGYGRADSLRTEYAYNLDNSIKEVLDPNGLQLEYTYDNYGRMIEAYRNGKLLQEASYSHWGNDHSQNFKDRALMNFVDQRNHIDPGMSFGSKAYVDPLGRNVANVNYGGINAVSIENNIFDVYGRAVVQLKPDGGGPAVNLGSASSAEHAEFEYDVAPLSRPLKSSKYGESINGQHVVEYAYCLLPRATMMAEIEATGKATDLDKIQGQVFSRTETVDEDGKKVIEFTNPLGQKVASISNDGTIATLFRYGSHGNVIEVSNAKEQQSLYKYNYLGQLYEKATVDGGTTYYGYDHTGNLLCEVHANGHTSMYRYDAYGRMVAQKQTNESYLANEGRAWLEERDYASYLTILENATFEKSWHYESYDDTSPSIASNAMNYLNNSVTYAKGKLVQTTSYDLSGQAIEYRFVSYTKDGFLKWEISQFNQNGLQGGGEGVLTRIDYPSYNLQGNYKLQNIDLNCDQSLDFQYAYSYDTWNRLEKVYINYDDKGENGHLIASYEYDDAMGVVEKKTYTASGISVDENTGEASVCKNVSIDLIEYDYDLRFRLTGINSNLFDWKLYYDANRNEDHLDNFTANYNGNINASLGTYKFAMAENIPQNFGELASSAYNYQYDKLNRLIVANAKISLVETLADQDKLGDAFYVYDKIGNIERLNRHSFATEGALAIVNNNYTYNYASGNNRLLSVYEEIIGNGGGSVTSNTLAEYAYDASGNLTSDTKRQLTVGQYGRAHLPWQMGKTSDVVIAGPEGGSSPLTSTIRYLYDANDARIYKSSQGSLGPEISEYYLRSASGQELAVYDLNTDELTWYVYGNERVAKIKNDPSLTEEEEDDRDTEYEGIPTSTPNPPIPPGNSCASRHPRCFGFGTNLQRDFVLNTQLSAIHAQNAARVASLQALYSTEESAQLNLPDTWMQLEMANETTQYVLLSQLSSIQGAYTVVDQLVLNSTAQQIQVQLNGKTISLSLSELLGEEVGEETTNDDGVGDPYDAPLDILDDPGIPEASYYIQDHLGNTRIVYKPLFCGEELLSYDVEYAGDYFPYGKVIREYVKGKKEKYLTTHHERDEETGLDYRGARFYDSDVARFLSLDPLAVERLTLTPYNYVQNNPILRIDPSGALDSPIFDSAGNFLGVDSEGYTGEIVIMHEGAYDILSGGGKNVISHGTIEGLTNDGVFANKLNDSGIGAEAYSNVLTHVTLQMEGESFDGTKLEFSKLEGGKIQIANSVVDEDGYLVRKLHGTAMNSASQHASTFVRENGDINVTAVLYFGVNDDFGTVENVQSTFGIHEYYGHSVKGLGMAHKEHKQVYKLQQEHKRTYNKLTSSYKKYIDESAN